MKNTKNTAVNAFTFPTMKAYKNALKVYGVGSLLTVGADAKTIKGQKRGFTTGIVYMQPNDHMCPASKSAGCRDACLVSAGRGKFNSVKQARANKTALFDECPELFFGGLLIEIGKLKQKHGERLVIRLNGTSDIAYEDIEVFNPQTGITGNIFQHFPDVQYYDYTKRLTRARKALPDNYDLTLSYSGARLSYAARSLKIAKETGTRLAVVFSSKRLPDTFRGLPVIDGDSTDLRFLDPANVVIGLYAKGEAKKDTSGFTVQTANLIASA